MIHSDNTSSILILSLSSAFLGAVSTYYVLNYYNNNHHPPSPNITTTTNTNKLSSLSSSNKKSSSTSQGISLLDHSSSLSENILELANQNAQTLPILGALQPIRTNGVEDLIGHTPMIEIKSLSEATGCRILAKLEMANPGGSAKDRVALAIIQDAEKRGLIQPYSGDAIFEGTSGSTGISLAMLARAKGYTAHIALPDDTSTEKIQLLETLGATVYKVRPASIVDENQYVNFARTKTDEINKRADLVIKAQVEAEAEADVETTTTNNDTSNTDSSVESSTNDNAKTTNTNNDKDKNTSNRPPRALFADQFENEANWKTHFANTGPEIYAQTQGRIDVFVTGAGTGGTISGVARYLKSVSIKNNAKSSSSSSSPTPLRVILADPQGSGFYNRIKYNVMFAPTEKEGTRRRHQVDTIVEGIGLNRITANFAAGERYIDDAVRVTDTEALKMAHWLVSNDGIFIGSSSAVNCVAAYRCAKALGPGHTIVTILCDSGSRHLSKFWKNEVSLKFTNINNNNSDGNDNNDNYDVKNPYHIDSLDDL